MADAGPDANSIGGGGDMNAAPLEEKDEDQNAADDDEPECTGDDANEVDAAPCAICIDRGDMNAERLEAADGEAELALDWNCIGDWISAPLDEADDDKDRRCCAAAEVAADDEAHASFFPAECCADSDAERNGRADADEDEAAAGICESITPNAGSAMMMYVSAPGRCAHTSAIEANDKPDCE